MSDDPTDKVRIHLVLGDRTKDGKVDVTVEIEGRLPVIGWVPALRITKNVPIKEAIGLARAACAVLPAPAGQIASTVLGVAQGLLSGLEAL